jgi:hypothetical protein
MCTCTRGALRLVGDVVKAGAPLAKIGNTGPSFLESLALKQRWVGENPPRLSIGFPPKVRFAGASPLEEAGFDTLAYSGMLASDRTAPACPEADLCASSGKQSSGQRHVSLQRLGVAAAVASASDEST